MLKNWESNLKENYQLVMFIELILQFIAVIM